MKKTWIKRTLMALCLIGFAASLSSCWEWWYDEPAPRYHHHHHYYHGHRHGPQADNTKAIEIQP